MKLLQVNSKFQRMKKYLIALFLTTWLLAGAQSEKSADSKPVNITVFLNKAQVTRLVNTQLEAGNTNLVISGLSAIMDPKSIQVSGKGAFTILGVSHRQNFLSEFNRPKSLKNLYDSLNYFQKQLQSETNKKETLEREEQLLSANQKFSGNTQNLTVNELKLMSDYFRTRIAEILSGKSRSADQIRYWNDRIMKINRQIAEQNELFSRNTGEIVVSVSAEKNTAAQLEIKYVVSNSGWSPVYDLKTSGTSGPVTIIYKAQVFQSTGEVWNDVRVSLSTANPNLSGTKPELSQWYLDIQQPIVIQNSKPRTRELLMAAPPVAAEMMRADLPEAETMAESVKLTQSGLNAEFVITTPQNIPSGPKAVVMDIQHTDLNASYEYSTVPKLDKNAFLMARVTGWDALSLLPGEANLFFEGTYVGKTFIDPNQVKDTISLSLGRDPRIIVTREKVKELSSRKLVGTNQRETVGWSVKLRNTKSAPVAVLVEDQVPVSINSLIEVVVVDAPGAKWDKQTGKLSWSMTLAPSESKTITFRYEVKYPKDKIINGL